MSPMAGIIWLDQPKGLIMDIEKDTYEGLMQNEEIVKGSLK